jgi:hypothetical protein
MYQQVPQQQPMVIVEQPMMMQQPMMGQQQMMIPTQPMMVAMPGMMQPMMMIAVQPTGLMKLGTMRGVFIKQKFLWPLGWVRKNTYNVFDRTEGDQQPKGRSIFKFREESSCCVRVFCHPHCRPFKMDAHNDTDQNQDIFMKLHREYTCTFYCLNRPRMKVHTSDDRLLGQVVCPWLWYNWGVDVYGEDLVTKIYRVEATCAQVGIWFRGYPCKPCQTVDFMIKDAAGNPCGFLQKRTAGCLKVCLADTANFALEFPQTATPEEKALLTSAVIFLDFLYFEERPGKNNGDIA